MTLEQNVERLYFISGDGYEEEALPREIFTAPCTLSIEPEQIPFFTTGTHLFGYHDLTTAEGEPKRKLLLGLTDPKTSKRFSLLGPNAQPIPVYDSPANALFELQPRVLHYQRQNTEKFLETLTEKNCTLRFTSGEYAGSLSVTNGKATRAALFTSQETLYGESALAAFLLLFSYHPLRLEQLEAAHNEPTTKSLTAVQPLTIAALPAYAHTLRETLEQKGLDQHLFNVRKENGTYQRAGDIDYSVVVRFSNISVGLLRFVGGKYYDGVMRGDEMLTGDEALRRTLELSNEPTITLERINSKPLSQFETLGSPATRSALATTALYFTQH